MDVGEDSRRHRRGRPHWLVELVAQIASDRDIISPGRYCAYNAFLGIILLGIAAIIAVDPDHGPESGDLDRALPPSPVQQVEQSPPR